MLHMARREEELPLLLLQEPSAIPIKTTTSVRQAEQAEQAEEELHMKRDFSFASL